MWLLDGMALPLFVLVVHLGASTALAGFSYFQKTSGYIIPVLLLGRLLDRIKDEIEYR